MSVDDVVASYLRSRGYTSSEAALRSEANLKSVEDYQGFVNSQSGEASIADFILFNNEVSSNNPAALKSSYLKLRKWIDESLELYKFELKKVLYPIFVHAYFELIQQTFVDQARLFFDSFKHDHMEDHATEMARIASIFSPDHLEENEFAQQFRNNRYLVRMSQYSFELLLAFLQDNKFHFLTRLINRHLSIKVEQQRPGLSTSDVISGIVGVSLNTANAYNAQNLTLGKLSRDPWLIAEVERAVKDKKVADFSDDDLVEWLKDEDNKDNANRDSVPMPYPRFSDVLSEIKAFKSMKARISLEAGSLPSICCFTFHNSASSITSITCSPNSSSVLAGFSDSYVRLWNLKRDGSQEREPSSSLIGHSGPVYGSAFTPDCNSAITSSGDGTIRLWSLQSKTSLAVYRGHNYPVWDVDISQDGAYFVSSSFDSTARLWRLDMTNPLRIFVGHGSDVNAVRFHPNSNYVATVSSDHQVRLWSVQKGTCVRLMKGGSEGINTLAFSPDGRTLATSGDSNAIKIWDLGSSKLIKTLVGHTDLVYSLAFSKDGMQLASGGADNSVRIWDAKGAEVVELKKEFPLSNVKSLGVYQTKKTPIQRLQFTDSNILLAFGPLN